MDYLSNCHTHTLFCDGKASPEEMAAKAASLSFVSLGFTAHSPLPYANGWTLPFEKLPAYLAAVKALQNEYAGRMEILSGIELDSDTPDSFSMAPFDVIITSLHTLHSPAGEFSVDYSPAIFEEGLQTIFGGDKTALLRAYYETVAENALRELSCPEGSVRVLGHFDLITKYNKGMRFFDENDASYQKIAMTALEKVLSSPKGRELFIEVNTGVMFRAGKDYPYPAPFLLRQICRMGGKMVINSDAHCTEFLYAGFDKAAKLLYEAGFREVYRFRRDGDGVRAEALPLI